ISAAQTHDVFELDASRPQTLELHSRSFSHELRLVSFRDGPRRRDYVLGAVWHHNETASAPGLSGSEARRQDTPRPASLDGLTVDDIAAFFDTGYALTDRLNAHVGLRTAIVRNRESLTLPAPELRFAPDFHPWTGRAVLSYAIDPDAMLWASVSRG